MKKYFSFFIFHFLFLMACGHSLSTLPDSRDVASSEEERPATQENQPDLTPPAPLPPSVKTLTLQEYEAAPARPRHGIFYRSPLTSVWQETFMEELGLSRLETLELYHSSIFSPIFALEDSENQDWFEFLPPIWLDPWFASKCIFCQSKKSVSLGNAKQFLTDEKTGPNLLGTGSSPSTAHDPRTRRYVIVWDEKGGNGAADVFARLVDENGTPVAGMERKKMSVERPSQGCLFSGFSQRTGISVPTDCKENVEPSVAYHNGRFLITWTKRGKAIAPAGAKFSVIVGRMVNADNLEHINENWQEGILLSKISFYSADPNQGARNDSEVVSWRQNEHSALAPFFGGAAQALDSFLLVWETNKDYAGCSEAELRTSTSIYGRVISPNFNPQGGNPDIFPIYKDPSTAQAECAPNADVDSVQKPRVAYLSDTRQFLTVFEVSKNISESLPSIGGNLVTVRDDFSSSVGNMYRFEPLDSQVYEGCYDPDVVSGPDHFMLIDNIGRARLKLTKVTIDRGIFNTQNSPPYVAPEGKLAQRPKVTLNRLVGEEGGSHPHPLEYVVAYEWKPTGVGSVDSKVQVISFNEQLNPQDPRLTLTGEGFPTNIHPALASGAEKVLVAWNAIKRGESQILDSVVTVNRGVRENQKPVAVIDVRRDEGGPVIEGEPVILESGSSVIVSGERSFDPENRLDAFRWRQTEGRSGIFENASGVTTNFTAPSVSIAEELMIELRVIDQEGLSSDPVTKRIRMVPPTPRNNPPRARISRRIGDVDGEPTTAFEVPESERDPVVDPRERTVDWPPTSITLSAAKSDDGEDPPHSNNSNNLGFHWDQVNATGSNRVLPPLGSDGTIVSFEVPNVSWVEQSKTIVIRLTVTKAGGITDTEDVTITVTTVNHRPTAPVLISPNDGVVRPPTRLLLRWEESSDLDIATDGDRLVYDVYFGTEDTPTTPAPGCLGIRVTRCLITELVHSTSYWWRVQVKDSSNEVIDSLLSSVRSLGTDDSVVGWWRFDNERNLTFDSSWQHHGADFHGDRPRWVNSSAILGGALELNGTNYFTVSNRPVLNPRDQITFEVRFRPNRFGMAYGILQGGGDGFTTGWRLNTEDIPGGAASCYVTPSGNISSAVGAIPLVEGAFNHVSCSYDGTKIQSYINGQFFQMRRVSGPLSSSSELSIGTASGVSHFEGLLDEVIVYNRALTGQEILNHYCSVISLLPRDTNPLPASCP